MSKERELLKRCLDFMLDAGANLNPLFKEVNDELLAQPEQEPVAWMYKQMDCHGEWGTIFKVDKPYITYHNIKDIVPVYTVPQNHDLREDLREGISLRDHFAGLAMQSLLVDATSLNNAASNSYDMADIMLKERDKRNDN